MDRFYTRNPSFLTNKIVGAYIQKRGMKRMLKPIVDNPEVATSILVTVAGASYTKV